MGNVADELALGRPRIVAVTGLRREAALIAAPGLRVLCGGGDGARLRADLEPLAAQADALISIGIAGALDPALKVGDCVLAGEVTSGASCYRVDERWLERLKAMLPSAHIGSIKGTDGIIDSVAGKAGLRAWDGSCAVDMESHVVAAVASARGVPFAVVRFVSDAADHALPPAALVGMKPGGGVDIAAVLVSVLRNPGQLPALIRTGRDARAAFGALLRGRQALGPSLGFADI